MCKREAPVDYTVRQRGDLAAYLRQLRDDLGHTNETLAAALGVSVCKIRRAASGKVIPKRDFILSWAKLRDANPKKAIHLWKMARFHTRLPKRRSTALPKPSLVTTDGMLGDALVELYELAGAPSFQEMEKKSEYGLLPHNTMHRIIRRQTLPGTEEQCRAFFAACEVARPDDWIEAWKRVTGAPMEVEADQGVDVMLIQVKHRQYERMLQRPSSYRRMTPKGELITELRHPRLSRSDLLDAEPALFSLPEQEQALWDSTAQMLRGSAQVLRYQTPRPADAVLGEVISG